MENVRPKVVENRDFVELEEEDIKDLSQSEEEKFRTNTSIPNALAQIESEIGPGGKWEEHWLSVDPSGRRILAKIYYGANTAMAITSDGHVIREIEYSDRDR
jgi:ABC-type dipeptide/oligopeptide/nickel transport system permease subunit